MAPKKYASKASAMPSRKVAPNPITARKLIKTKERAERPLKGIFKGLIFSFAGAFPSVSGGFLSHEQMAKWITLHGGKYEREVTSETTHLICTIEEYKKKGPQVLKAWKFSNRDNQCYILVFEWLEDCLQGHKRKRAERGYTLDRTIARLKKGKSDHVAFRAKFEEGVRASKDLCDNRLHKVYFDQDGFEYKIMLTHLDLSYNGKSKVEKYTLFLFESIAAPHTYMCGAKLSRSHRPVSYYRENCYPKVYQEAMKDFKQFFKDKTKITWDNRLEGIVIDDPKAFRYMPPVVGRPCGFLPFGYMRPEERSVTKSEGEDSSGSGTGSGSGSGTETTTTASSSESVEYDTDSEVDDTDEEEPAHTTGTLTRTPNLDQQRLYIPSTVGSSEFTPASTVSFGTQSQYTSGHDSSRDQTLTMTPNVSFGTEEFSENGVSGNQLNSSGTLNAPYDLGIYQQNSLNGSNDSFSIQIHEDGTISQREFITIDSD